MVEVSLNIFIIYLYIVKVVFKIFLRMSYLYATPFGLIILIALDKDKGEVKL